MNDFLTSDNLFGFVTGAYIIAGLLFIGALAGLSKHETAKLGNVAGMVGMGLALLATLLLAAQKAELLDERNFAVTLLLILVMMAAGGVIGAWRARTVEMTGMPELVAMLHSFVGLAAVLVGINSYLEYEGFADAVHDVEVFIGVFIGAVTLTGSIVAWAKLSGRMSSSPLTLPRRHQLNLGVIVVSVVLMVWFVALDGELALGLVPLLVMTALALFLGFHLVAAIGGGDMPVVVSMLNSLLRLGRGRGRLHARQRPADHRRRARRLLRCDPQLHHVQGDEPLLHQRHRRRLRLRPAGRRARTATTATTARSTPTTSPSCWPTPRRSSSPRATAWPSPRRSTPWPR